MEPFEAEEEGTLAARAGDRLLVLFPPNQANFILSMLRSGEFLFTFFSPPDQATLHFMI